MSLCTVLVGMINSSLKGKTNCKYMYPSNVFNFIEKETNIKECGFCQPVELIQSLLSVGKIPLYGFSGDTSTLHKETQVLLRLGFCYIEDQHLHLNKDLKQAIEDIETYEEYLKVKVKYNKMLVRLNDSKG